LELQKFTQFIPALLISQDEDLLPFYSHFANIRSQQLNGRLNARASSYLAFESFIKSFDPSEPAKGCEEEKSNPLWENFTKKLIHNSKDHM